MLLETRGTGAEEGQIEDEDEDLVEEEEEEGDLVVVDLVVDGGCAGGVGGPKVHT